MALFDEENRELLETVIPAMQRFLMARERTGGEIRQYLKKRRLCDESRYEAVLAWLAEEGLLNEERFVRRRITWRLEEGYGPLYIRNDLKKCMADREVAAAVLSEISDEEFAEAAAVAVARNERQVLR